MLTVHHLENSRSQRILWLLEELALDYELKRYPRDPKTRLAPAALKKVHPLGKSPVITDGEGDQQRVIAESGAIVEYVLANHGDGQLLPTPNTVEHGRYQYWLHFAEGTFMPLMVMSLIFNTIESKSPLLIKPIAKGITGQVKKNYLTPNITNNLKFMEQTLNQHNWFAGDELTGADILMSFPVEAASVRTDLSSDYPRLNAFLERIHARPAWQKAIEKGGAYELMTKA